MAKQFAVVHAGAAKRTDPAAGRVVEPFTPEQPQRQPARTVGMSANLGIAVRDGRVLVGPVHDDATYCRM